MERLSFLVNRGENDCLMAHGLDWAVYSEAPDWETLTESIRHCVQDEFPENERPLVLEFRFMDGTCISLSA